MAQVPVDTLHELATSALLGQGFPDGAAREVAEEFVVAEYARVKTHGVGKLPSMNLGDMQARAEVKQFGAVVSINGRGGSGFLIMRDMAQYVIDIARTEGVGLASASNFSRYSSLYPYTEKIAKSGMVGVLLNSAGPPAVAPFGSADPVTGTNPICFSFPTTSGVHTIDFATSEVVWGEVRLASQEDRGVAPGAFFDASGKVTTDPSTVHSVKAFGGAKGFSLNLALEILGGILTGGLGGAKVESEFQCGAIMLAINPAVTGAGTTFQEDIAQLLAEVRGARPQGTTAHIRAPGDRARGRIDIKTISAEIIEVPDAVISLLERMVAGEDTTELSSNPLYN